MAEELSFACDGCKREMIKRKVASHKLSCQKCQSLSCKACGQEFKGDDYEAHVKCPSQKATDSGKRSNTKKSHFMDTLRAFLKTSSLNPDLDPVWTRVKELHFVTDRFVRFKNLVKPLKLSPCLVEEAFGIISTVRQEFMKSWVAEHEGTVKAEVTTRPSNSGSKKHKRQRDGNLKNGNKKLRGDDLLAKKRKANKHGSQLGTGVKDATGVKPKVAAKKSRKNKRKHNKKKIVSSDEVDAGGETPMDVEVRPQTTE